MFAFQSLLFNIIISFLKELRAKNKHSLLKYTTIFNSGHVM